MSKKRIVFGLVLIAYLIGAFTYSFPTQKLIFTGFAGILMAIVYMSLIFACVASFIYLAYAGLMREPERIKPKMFVKFMTSATIICTWIFLTFCYAYSLIEYNSDTLIGLQITGLLVFAFVLFLSPILCLVELMFDKRWSIKNSGLVLLCWALVVLCGQLFCDSKVSAWVSVGMFTIAVLMLFYLVAKSNYCHE